VSPALAALAFLALSSAGAPGGARHYGKPLKGRAAIALRALLADPEAHAGQAVRVEGVIASLAPGGEGGLELRQGDERVSVTFAKPGWTLPAGAVGRRASVEGTALVTRPAAEEARAQPADGAGELRSTVTIEASGIEVYDR